MCKFNVTGLCIPEEDYMVDISDKIEQIKKLVDARSYFTINRARQYGKTTTLAYLEKTLKDEYIVISTSFEGVGDESFALQESFCLMFLRKIFRALEFTSVPEAYKKEWLGSDISTFDLLSDHITRMCKDKKVVLMIDEVDKTSNNRIFIHFLGMLRNKFLARKNGKDYTFHSVILAGVYDIKNIKLKMVSEGSYQPAPEENKLYNSPWNIAIDFEVDMSFNDAEIATMLAEYERDHRTNMDIPAISEEIHTYTNGYPYLVSRICKHIDEKLDRNWTSQGVQNAVQILLNERNTLFDDIYKNLENNKELYNFIYGILILGERYNFKFGNPVVELAHTFGVIENNNGVAALSNRIFEVLIYEYFISKEQTREGKRMIKGVLASDIIYDRRFNMQVCLEKFAAHYYEMFCEKDTEFLERHGRLLFLSYLRPLINGYGFYHIESETRNQRRMDIVVDFNREQFIIELKIWHGEKYKQEAYVQMLDYMESKNADTGYLLTFDFRKSIDKKPYAEWVELSGKRIFDVVL
ncbi:MAG: AAA-like domain-containing protein [Peptococcaceae bacterium]|nr:AAA-like domain-containing protein [Peptococcaceae bacterium]